MSFGIMSCLSLIATLFFLIWIFLFIKYKNKYKMLLERADPKIFMLKEIYFIGLGAIEFYERRTGEKIIKSDKATVRIKELSEVFGRDSAELYYYILQASMVSLFLTFVPVGLSMGCVSNSFLGVAGGFLLVFAMMRGTESHINDSIKKKKEEISDEFPKMVSKLTLLINAGMVVRKAWDEVAYSNNTNNLYAEMRTASSDIQQGMSIEDAMESFANRCGTKDIRKFTSIYVQCVKRGASDSIDSMKAMTEEAWEKRKQTAKQKGANAANQLIMPTMIMFMGILIVIIVPIVSSMFGSFSF